MQNTDASLYSNIPDELKRLDIWCITVGTDKKPMTFTSLKKPPFNASSTNPQNWLPFDECLKAVEAGKATGLGLIIFGNKSLFCIDLDNVVDDNGNIKPSAMEILDRFAPYCYIEYSRSGKGFHIIGKLVSGDLEKPKEAIKDPKNVTYGDHRDQFYSFKTRYDGYSTEVYLYARFMITTGKVYCDFRGFDTQGAVDSLIWFYKKVGKKIGADAADDDYDDGEVLNKSIPVNDLAKELDDSGLKIRDHSILKPEDYIVLKEFCKAFHNSIPYFNGEEKEPSDDDRDNTPSGRDFALVCGLLKSIKRLNKRANLNSKKVKAQIVRILKSSYAFREKWIDNHHYLPTTINNAIKAVKEDLKGGSQGESSFFSMLDYIIKNHKIWFYEGVLHIDMPVTTDYPFEYVPCYPNNNNFRWWILSLAREFNVNRSRTLPQRVIDELLAMAPPNTPRCVLVRRKGYINGKGYYKLAAKRYCEIDSSGYRIISQPPDGLRFWENDNMVAQPDPKPGDGWKSFCEIFDNFSRDDQIRILMLIVQMIWPDTKYHFYTHTLIKGKPGTGKTTAADLMTLIVDPVNDIDRGDMKSLSKEDLGYKLINQGVLQLDNVSVLKEDVSDTLCKISSKDSSTSRKLYAQGESYSVTVHGPVIITGVDMKGGKADFYTRVLTLKPKPVTKAESKKDLIAKLEKCKPEILHMVFSLISAAMKNIDHIALIPSPSRLIDLVKISLAWSIEGIVPITPYEVIKVIEESSIISLQENIQQLAEAVKDFILKTIEKEVNLKTKLDSKGYVEYEEEAKEFFRLLKNYVDTYERDFLQYIPKTATALGKRLNEFSPVLSSFGIEIDTVRKGAQKQTFYRIKYGCMNKKYDLYIDGKKIDIFELSKSVAEKAGFEFTVINNDGGKENDRTGDSGSGDSGSGDSGSGDSGSGESRRVSNTYNCDERASEGRAGEVTDSEVSGKGEPGNKAGLEGATDTEKESGCYNRGNYTYGDIQDHRGRSRIHKGGTGDVSKGDGRAGEKTCDQCEEGHSRGHTERGAGHRGSCNNGIAGFNGAQKAEWQNAGQNGKAFTENCKELSQDPDGTVSGMVSTSDNTSVNGREEPRGRGEDQPTGGRGNNRLTSNNKNAAFNDSEEKQLEEEVYKSLSQPSFAIDIADRLLIRLDQAVEILERLVGSGLVKKVNNVYVRAD